MSKDKEKEKGGLSEYRSKDKLATYILVGVWLVLLVCSAILFGIVGQNMIDVYSGIDEWSEPGLGEFIAAIVLGSVGIIIYIIWAVLLFNKPKGSVIKIVNKSAKKEEKEKEVQNVATPAVAAATSVAPVNSVTNVAPVMPVAGYPRPSLPPRPVTAPANYPRPVATPGAYPRPATAPVNYPRPVAAPGVYPRPATAPVNYPRPVGYPPQQAPLPPRPVGYPPQQAPLPPRPTSPNNGYYPQR